MSRVFADAFFYIAVLNRRDAAHQRAMNVLSAGALQMVTTKAVLLEVADAMATPAWRGACAQFRAGGLQGVDERVKKARPTP